MTFMRLGEQQRHILTVAANARGGLPIYPQDRAQEQACDRLVEQGLLRIDGPKERYVTPCYQITNEGRQALTGGEQGAAT